MTHNPHRIVTVFGTRPEAIKVAPILRALGGDDRFESIPVVTGQHREMLDQVNVRFEIEPRHDLDLMRPGQSLNSIVSGALAGIDDVLLIEKPDVVVVQGDTSTAMAAALAAFNRRVSVVHVEAGLRTGDIDAPFPEEANRRLITQVAKLHLAPTPHARRNLLREAVDPTSIVVTGNTVIDALLMSARWRTRFSDPKLNELASGDRKIVLATTHRRENLGEGMLSIARALADIATANPELSVVLPLHRNPSVRDAVIPHVESLSNVLVTEPLSYEEFTKLMQLSTIVITDSGGVQEEAPSLGKPVLVLREKTERPEAVAAGTVRLVGTDRGQIVAETQRLLDDQISYAEMANAVNPYGDGHASDRAVAAIGALLGLGDRLPDFEPAD